MQYVLHPDVHKYLVETFGIDLVASGAAVLSVPPVEEAAQQSVQPTCSTCGAKLRSGDIWWNECEKCHSKIASG